MALEIKIEISAEPALLATLQALAGGNMKTENVKASKLYQSCNEVVTLETPAPATLPEKPAEKPAEPVEEQKKDPNATVDSEFLPAIRSTVADYCKLKGKDDGKAAVKKWLTDRNIGGLSKMTFGQADEFCAWLESEIEVLKNAG